MTCNCHNPSHNCAECYLRKLNAYPNFVLAQGEQLSQWGYRRAGWQQNLKPRGACLPGGLEFSLGPLQVMIPRHREYRPKGEQNMEEERIHGSPNWRNFFDERQQKEIKFAELYAAQFCHGTTGHNDMLIIAKLADLLDKHFTEVRIPLGQGHPDCKP